jgi:hypothetical protein
MNVVWLPAMAFSAPEWEYSPHCLLAAHMTLCRASATDPLFGYTHELAMVTSSIRVVRLPSDVD